MSSLRVNLARGAASRGSGPSQAVGRDGRNTPCPSFPLDSRRLFLNGLLASIARLRFADGASIKLLPHPMESFTIERRTVS